jgi:hypothetical protein
MFVGLSFHNVIVGQTLYILDNAETIEQSPDKEDVFVRRVRFIWPEQAPPTGSKRFVDNMHHLTFIYELKS